MSTIDQFSLYSKANEIITSPQEDEVDKHINTIKNLKEYEDVVNYVKENFGEISEDTVFNYEELNKQISIVTREDCIEICARKDENQYFGQGWKLVTPEQN